MCGIFGFALRRPVRVYTVIELLKILEQHQVEGEKFPLGGYGAGIAFLTLKGEVKAAKVGRIVASPSERLYKMISDESARILIGHVRFPSREFMQTSVFKETSQPYVTNCVSNLTVISAHNGKVANYKELKENLKLAHVFESEKVEFIDSEVIPHLFEELVTTKTSPEKAFDRLFTLLEGNNTTALLQLNGSGEGFLHLLHKGKTRGLTVWTNKQQEILFCTRKAVVEETSFERILLEGEFHEIFSAGYREPKFWRRSFQLRIDV